MTVFIPYIYRLLAQETRAWAEARTDTELWLLPEDDKQAYWRMVNFLWTSPTVYNLTIVEHDMVPARDVIEQMECCPKPWCTSPYRCGLASAGDLTDGLGCTKFSQELRKAHPDIPSVVACIADDGVPAKDWRRLDVRMARVLRSFGYEPHVHERSIHLHYERP